VLKTALGHRAEISTEIISTVLKFSLLSLRCICLLWKGSVVFVAIFESKNVHVIQIKNTIFNDE